MSIEIRRFPGNPIVHPGSHESIGSNINGPSLIRVPDWIEEPLGRYYLYFAHHQGQFIRLAYAESIQGPWHVHAPGTLRLDQTVCWAHVASPDVHVDHAERRIRMYFHGCLEDHQRSFVAFSSDGLHFEACPTVLGPFYFRVFEHDSWTYAIAKSRNSGGVLMRSRDGLSPFEEGPTIVPRLRHTAVRKAGSMLQIFLSRGEDAPERIMLSLIDLTRPWPRWEASEAITVLEPELAYEGADLPIEPSLFGAVHTRARQLRDPALFEENGKSYLLYSIAGEHGIALAEMIGL